MDIMATTDLVPSSPPGLDSSRSSTKSSSLRSSLPQDNIHDISHFEDISLTESPSPSPSPKILDLYSAPTFANPIKARPALGRPTHLISLSNRSIASSPNIHTIPIHSDSISPKVGLQNRSPRSSWLKNPSANTLATSHLKPPYALQPPSLTRSQTSGQTPPLKTELKSSGHPGGPTRRASWQPARRKSTKELEDEYDDLDEELPDDAVTWNIPLSPRPKDETQLFLTNSPGSDDHRSNDDTSSTTSPIKSRAKTWEAALSGLTPEIQKLTNELGAHSDPFGSKTDLSSSKSPTSTVKQIGRSMNLPPVQKSNNIVDPLPVSKVKEKFLTRTRPSWLPPKCPKEEKRHLKEYQRMMASFWESEKQKSVRKSKSTANLVSEKKSAVQVWQTDILDNWENGIHSAKSRELWWQGIPATLRAKVWDKTIGNELHLSPQSYKAALGRADRSNLKLRKSPTAQSILTDIASTFPAVKLFQQSRSLHEPLLNVLHAYAAYRSDADYIRGTSGIAAILLHVFDGDEEKTFVNLANVMNRTISLIYCLDDGAGIHRVESFIQKSVQAKMPHLAAHLRRVARPNPQDTFEGSSSEGQQPGGEYSGWLDLICTSLFTGILSLDDCLRVWDIMLFEDETFVLQAVVGLLRAVEDRLYSCDIVAIDGLLGWNAWSQRAESDKSSSSNSSYKRGLFGSTDAKKDGLDVGGSEKLVAAIQWAGKDVALA